MTQIEQALKSHCEPAPHLRLVPPLEEPQEPQEPQELPQESQELPQELPKELNAMMMEHSTYFISDDSSGERVIYGWGASLEEALEMAISEYNS